MTTGYFKGDCLDLLPTWSGIDVCIADPPYGIDYQSNKRDTTTALAKIANDRSPFVDWLPPLFDAMNDRGRLVCFYRWDVQEAFVDAIQAAGFVIRAQLVWNKLRYGMGDLTAAHAPAHELALYATKGRYEFKRKRPLSVYSVKRVHGKKLIHPNQKPDRLIEQMIRDLSEPGELICDPMAGSNVTGRVAVRMSRRFVGCEVTDEYYRIGRAATDPPPDSLFSGRGI